MQELKKQNQYYKNINILNKTWSIVQVHKRPNTKQGQYTGSQTSLHKTRSIYRFTNVLTQKQGQ